MSHEFRVACELHSAERLRAALDAGLDPHRPTDGKAAITWLTEMYTRSDRFTEARVAGLTWGRGFEWETTFCDLTPIAYAQLGLLPQMHRDARDIDGNIRALLAAAGRTVPTMPNVPNRYLAARGDAVRSAS